MLDVILNNSALVDDAVRILHLAAIAAGIGAVIATDLTMLRLLGVPIGSRHGAALEVAHRLIGPALLGAWVTGIALIGLRTGFAVEAFSPKLWMKLAVVTALSLNVLLIKRIVQPTLDEYEGWTLAEIPLAQKLSMALGGAISVAGWSAALFLGASRIFKTASWELLVPTVGACFLTAALITVSFAIVAHWRWRLGCWLRERITGRPHYGALAPLR